MTTDSNRPARVEFALASLPTMATIVVTVACAVWFLSNLMHEQKSAVERVGYQVQTMDSRVTRIEKRVERIVVRLPASWHAQASSYQEEQDP